MSAIVGFFDQYNNADQAIQKLQNYGVDSDRISVVVRDTDAVEHKNGMGKAALAGIATGGLVGVLAGLSTLVVPGMGLISVAGTLATTLATTLGLAAVGAGLGAATGGLLGALIDLGFSKEEAETYTASLQDGGIMIFVETDSQEYDDQGEINHILRSAGAVDINAPRQTWNAEGRVSIEEPKNLIHKGASH